MKQLLTKNWLPISLFLIIIGMGFYIKSQRNKNVQPEIDKLKVEIKAKRANLDSINAKEDKVLTNLDSVSHTGLIKAKKAYHSLPVKRETPDVEYSEKVEYLKNVK